MQQVKNRLSAWLQIFRSNFNKRRAIAFSALLIMAGIIVALIPGNQALIADADVIRIDTGANAAYIDGAGNKWLADTYGTGGVQAVESGTPSFTDNPNLWKTVRIADTSGSPFSYAIPVKASGIYNVKLSMIELWFASPNSRVFSVSAEGKQIIGTIDLVELVGKGNQLNAEIPVNVTDGTLNLTFTSITNRAIVSAITVTSTMTDATTPVTQNPSVSRSIEDSELGGTPNKFEFDAGWKVASGSPRSGETDRYSDMVGSTVKFRFTGTNFKLYGKKAAHHGSVDISVDGGAAVDVSTRSTNEQWNTLLWDSGALRDSSHVITIKVKTGMNTIDRAVIADTAAPVPTPNPNPTPNPTPNPNPNPQPPVTSTGKWLSGACCRATQDFGNWRGNRVTIAGIWGDTDDGNARNIYWMDEFKNWDENMDIAPGMTVAGENMAAAGNGAYEDRWRTAMKSVYNRWGNKKTIYIRPAHEMNGNWYPWSVTPGNVNDFKKAWVRYYNIIQQELVQKGKPAKVVFNYSKDPVNGMSAESIWPGNQYVDVVGVDFYDMYPSYFSQADWDNHYNATRAGGPYGIGAWQAFAKSKGKSLAFPEWGAHPQKYQDNPFYIQKMYEFFKANAGTGPGQVEYEIYFNTWDQVQIFPSTKVPKAAAKYKELF